MARIVWKGAISFGLVHVPVVVYPAARSARLDFDWIDKRDMAPVGYQRINKRTGKVIQSENIVKGYEYEKGEYVLMSDEDFRQANVAATQTVEILAFTDATAVPIIYFDTPYYLEPDRRGEKGYRLLRDVLARTGRIGIAQVVLHTKQHLAALIPAGDALILNTLRYADEIYPLSDLKLPAGKGAADAPSAREFEMAARLVDNMTQEWEPQQFHDTYREDLLARIERKIQFGQTHALAEIEAEAPAAPRSSNVIDLVTLLKQSIDKRARTKPLAKKSTPAKKSSAKKTVATHKTSVGKTAASAGRRSGSAGRRRAA